MKSVHCTAHTHLKHGVGGQVWAVAHAEATLEVVAVLVGGCGWSRSAVHGATLVLVEQTKAQYREGRVGRFTNRVARNQLRAAPYHLTHHVPWRRRLNMWGTRTHTHTHAHTLAHAHTHSLP
jgi:hypothetical protein